MDIKRDQRSRNGVEPVARKRKTGEELSVDAVKKLAKSKQQTEDDMAVRPERSGKAKVVEAVASAVVAEKIKNPAVRQKVMTEVSRQLDKQSAKGRDAAAVRVYDKNAPAKARDTERARPPIDRNTERTR